MGNAYTEIEDVTFKRESGSGKAFLCKWQGTSQWVPKSQISPDQDELEEGTTGSLLVRDFIVDRWFDDKPEDDTVSVGQATVLQESAKALRVRLKDLDNKETWIPKAVIADDSEVKEDPDRGDLKILKNFAEREHLLADSSEPERNAGEEVHSTRWEEGPDDDIQF